MTEPDALLRDYRVAFLSYLSRSEESALHRGYELGRSAVVDGLSMLDLIRVHHQVLLEVLNGTHRAAEDVALVATAGSDFLLEVLATYDMTQRGFGEPR